MLDVDLLGGRGCARVLFVGLFITHGLLAIVVAVLLVHVLMFVCGCVVLVVAVVIVDGLGDVLVIVGIGCHGVVEVELDGRLLLLLLCLPLMLIMNAVYRKRERGKAIR
jgi:hypothetical protein